MKKSGFTLSEVLITLAIIGVVAALTIPSVVKKYQETQTIAQLKKAYSQLYQAINLSETQNANLETWDFTLSNQDFYDKYFKNYLKIIKYYGYNVIPTEGSPYRSASNDTSILLNRTNSIKVILGDGTLASFRDDWIYIDINGTKNPNKYGKDVFIFQYNTKNKLLPVGFVDSNGNLRNRELLKFGEAESCGNYGTWCAALIMKDGWQIKDDYPW